MDVRNVRVVSPTSPHAEFGLQTSTSIQNLIKDIPSPRSFSLDIFPCITSSQSSLVNLLIQSSAGKYLEFKSLSEVYVYSSDGEFSKVPGRKEDVFKEKKLSLVEKRRVMKVLTIAGQLDQNENDRKGMNYRFSSQLQIQQSHAKRQSRLCAETLS